MAIRQGKLNEYVFALVHHRNPIRIDAAPVETGTFRLYEALANNPLSAQRLAKKTGADARAVREWLAAQATHGHLQYDAARQQYWMTEQQAFAISRAPGLSSAGTLFRSGVAAPVHSRGDADMRRQALHPLLVPFLMKAQKMQRLCLEVIAQR